MNIEERQTEIARSLFREATDAFFLFDPESQRVVDLNPAAQRLSGLEKRAACAKTLRDLFFSASSDGIEKLLESLDQTSFFHSREGYFLQRTTGAPLSVNISTCRIHTQPDPIGLVVARDVSDRKRAEEELRQAEARYKSLVDLTGVVVWEFDHEGRIAALSQAFETITGWRRSDWLGRSLDGLLDPDDVEKAYRLFLEAREGRVLPRFELRVRTSRGEFSTTEFLLVTRIGTGPRERILGIARDVTEQKRLEESFEQAESMRRAKEQAEQANRAKTEFLSNVSHEIRTPLSVILGFTELLVEHPSLRACDGEVHEYVRAIQLQGGVLLALVDDLLDLARIEAGQLRMVREPWSIPRILSDLVESFRARAEARNLTLDAQIEGEIPDAIATDRLRIHQILVNLVDNAIKYTERGEIRLTARVLTRAESDPLLQLEVTDSGIGMTSAEMEGLFHPFYRVRSTPWENTRGTGLGLAICQRLAQQLGGEVTVRSAPGSGTTFTLRVPVGVPEKTPAGSPPFAEGRTLPQGSERPAQPQPQPRSQPQLQARILLAEDHEANRQIISHRLSQRGAQVFTARNGAEALRRVGEAAAAGNPVDIVIMDMEMPVLDGYEAVRQLRAKGFTAPIVALTAYAMSIDRDECLSIGCDEHVSKPVDWNLLFTKLADLLARREAATWTE